MMLLTLVEQVVNGYFAKISRKKPPAQYINNALLIAHRGAHDTTLGVLENTLDAFDRAFELGCWGIEFDIQCTADSILVVHHDPTLKRMWGHQAAIADLSFEQLRHMEPRIPSLEEVISRYAHKLHLFIELKTACFDEANLKELLGTLTPCQDYHLLALKPQIFELLTHFDQNALLLVAVHNNVKQFCDLSIRKSYGGVLGNYLLLTNKWIHRLQQANQAYGVGFVDSQNSLFRELNRGIDWIFTNKATKMALCLKSLKSQPCAKNP